MKLTTLESEKIKQHLPVNWVELVGDEINWAVGESMIRKIINGAADDNHDVIAIATRIAKEQKEKEAEIKNQLNQL